MDGVGPTIVGRRSTPGADAARDLLTRNEVPHRWVDLDRDPLAPLLETESLSAGRLPLLLFPDGTRLAGVEDCDPLFLESSQPGLFVAGDVRHGSTKRVASAVGEGALVG